MPTEDPVLIGLYLAGFVGIVSAVIMSTRKKRVRMPLEPGGRDTDSLPGRIFVPLLGLREYLDATNDFELRNQFTLQVQDELTLICANVNTFIANKYNKPCRYENNERKLLENVAVCMRAFLDQIRKERRRSKLSANYTLAVDTMISSINAFYAAPAKTKDEFHTCMESVIDCKAMIFSSLYGENPSGDRDPGESFLLDFVPAPDCFADRQKMRSYLGSLKVRWADHEVAIRGIDSSYILPLMTIKNILSFCLQLPASQEGKFANYARSLAGLFDPKHDPQFRAICRYGLLFDNQNTVETIYQDYFEKLSLVASGDKGELRQRQLLRKD